MALVSNLVPVTQGFANFYRGGGKQYFLTAAVADRSGTAINLSTWDSVTAVAPAQTNPEVSAIDVAVTGNADGTMLLTMSENDFTQLINTGSILIEGTHLSGDDAQLLGRLQLSISN